jgi:hypothetical protein
MFAFEFFGAGFTHEGGGHVRLWAPGLRPWFCMVSSTCHIFRDVVTYLYFLGSLSELVQDGENGLVFENAGELAGQLEVGCKK